MSECDDAAPGPKDDAVSSLLDKAAMVEAPPDLRDNVLRAIEGRRPVGTRWGWLEFFGAGFKRPAFGMVYPFAVGAIAGIVGFAILTERVDLGTSGGPAGMSGAMVPTAPSAKAVPVDAQRYELNGANIRLETVRRGDQIGASIAVEGRRDVEVTLRFDPSRLAPVAFRQDRPWDGRMEYGPGLIRLVQSGERRYEIDFVESGAGDAPIQVTMISEGATAQGVVHTAPAGKGA